MRLIATDYDGTLNHGGIDEEKLTAIRRWRAAGNKFGVISGRGPGFLSQLQEELGEEFDFLASCNGGYATDRNGNLLFKYECDSLDTRAFVTDILNWGGPMVYINYDDKCERVATADYKEEYEYLPETMPDIPAFYKMATFLAGPDEAAVLTAQIREKYGHAVNPLQNWWCVDIAPVGIDKAEGIRHLCRHFGVAEENVIAVGDNLNDLAMIEAFYSYAMEHGSEELKAKATHTIDNVTNLIFKELEG